MIPLILRLLLLLLILLLLRLLAPALIPSSEPAEQSTGGGPDRSTFAGISGNGAADHADYRAPRRAT